jgi:hypothetical protein
MSALAEFTTVVIDCAKPAALAEFYRKIVDWEVTYSDEDCVYLGNGGPVQLGFQRVDGYRAAGWPDDAKHSHLDLKVTDLEQATKELVAIGAAVPEFQPGENQWRVLTDPEGHAFCLVAASVE